jgi:hypothetical protein
MRFLSFCLWAALPGGWLLAASSLHAQTPAQQEADSYVAPAGAAPPVAPPLRKGSPLDHLAHDPKMASLPIGYREGNTSGAPYGIGHRMVDDDGGQGWGWIRKSDDDWNDGKWVALQETPGLVIAPFRRLLVPNSDSNWEFKVWGSFAGYEAYDPHLDELLPVFVLQGYQVIGPANPLHNKVGPPGRIQHRPSGASSRNSNPIQTDHPGVD